MSQEKHPLTGFSVFQIAFLDANRHWRRSIKDNWKSLLVLLFVTQLIHEYFTLAIIYDWYSHLGSFDLPTGNIKASDAFGKFGKMSAQLLESINLMFIILPCQWAYYQKTSPESPTALAKRTLASLFVESLRATAVTLLWSIFLIIPGVFKSIRLYFVPFVVFFDQQYDEGKRDALSRSNQLVKSIGIFVFLVLVLDFALQGLIDSSASNSSYLTQPVKSFVTALLTMGISIYSFNILLSMFYYRFESLESKE